jgi:hypothetical protein
MASFPRNMSEFGYYCDNTGLFPVFMCIHFYLVVASLRSQVGAVEYSRQHPLASWFVCVTACFGGTALQNFLLGRPIVEIYLNKTNVLTASLVWYLVFFAPCDILTNICSDRLVKTFLLLLKEVQRMRGIKAGVLASLKVYPESWFVAVLMGAVRGSGAKLVGRPLFYLVRGDLKAENELLKPTFSTKNSVMTAALLLLQIKGVLDVQLEVLIGVLVLVAGVVQVLLLWTDMKDPYTHIECVACKVALELPKGVKSSGSSGSKANKKKVQ